MKDFKTLYDELPASKPMATYRITLSEFVKNIIAPAIQHDVEAISEMGRQAQAQQDKAAVNSGY